MLAEGLTIKSLPLSERPRERLLHYGAGNLSSAELLAIILRTGTAEQTVVTMAEHLLAAFGDLVGLYRASCEEIAKIKGIGPAKAIQIKAAFELGRRTMSVKVAEQPTIHNPQDVFNLLQATFQYLDREHFKVLHLNTKNQVMKVETTSIGLLNSAPVHPREVFKEAVRMNSSGLILAHNHPSGDPSPSKDDLKLTARLYEAGNIIGIQIMDHLIFGNNCFVSLNESGYLV